MDKRETELFQLKQYSKNVDNELTMILQSLQWDRNKLLEGPDMVTCKCDPNHRLPTANVHDHESYCSLRRQGYVIEDQLLPESLDSNANTLIKLSSQDINNIIENVSRSDPLFRKVSVNYMVLIHILLKDSEYIVSLTQGGRSHGALATPQSLGRLHCTYTPDERRAIHDAVVAAAPSCHDLADLALLTIKTEGSEDNRAKSRVEILAELRNLRRRRTRYRGAPNRNYSHELKELIATQMEYFNGAQSENKPTIAPADTCTNIIIKTEKYDESENSNADNDYYQKHERNRESTHNVLDRKRFSRDSSSYREEKHRDRERRERRYDDYNRRDSNHARKNRDESRSSRREERSDKPYRRKYEAYAESRKEDRHKRYYDDGDDYRYERKKLKK